MNRFGNRLGSVWVPGVYSGSPAISFGGSDVQLRGLAPAQSTVVRCQEQLPGGFELGSNQTSAMVLQGDAASCCEAPRLPLLQALHVMLEETADQAQCLQVSR
jgi:hypothetical protein